MSSYSSGSGAGIPRGSEIGKSMGYRNRGKYGINEYFPLLKIGRMADKYKRSANFRYKYSADNQPVTRVPTLSPVTTFFRLPGLFILKTIIGRLFSMHRVKAVMSITFRLPEMHS